MNRSVFRKTAVLCMALLCMAAMSASAAAVVIPVAPSGDGEFAEGSMEFGFIPGSATIGVSQSSFYDDWYGQWVWSYHFGIVKIPISSLSGMNLTGATITLNYDVLSAASSSPVKTWGVSFDGNGIAGAGDYDAFVGSQYARTNVATASPGIGWNTVDVASYVRDQLASGYSWANFFLDTSSGSTRIASAEDTQGRGAYLNVVPVPEPSSLMALMGGLAGLGGVFARRKK